MFRTSKHIGGNATAFFDTGVHCFASDLFKFYQKMVAMSTQPTDGMLNNELLTVQEVAIYLRVSRVTVWRWCQQGVIPASRFGRNWRIRQRDLLYLVDHPNPEAKLSPAQLDSIT